MEGKNGVINSSNPKRTGKIEPKNQIGCETNKQTHAMGKKKKPI